MEDNIQKYLRQYIRENQDTYTRDALTSKLLESGYSINDIDDAYEALGIGWNIGNLSKVEPASTFSASDKKVEKNNQRRYLEAFIQANRHTQKRLEIEKQLLAAGYSMADINSAYEVLQLALGDEGKQDLNALRDAVDWRYVKAHPVGCLLFFPLVPLLAYTLVSYTEKLEILLPIYSVVLALGLVLPRFLKKTYPDFAKGMMYGFWTLLVLFVCTPTVIIGVLWGICTVFYGNLY